MKITEENRINIIFRILYILLSLTSWFVIGGIIYDAFENNKILTLISMPTILFLVCAIFVTFIAIQGEVPKWFYEQLARNKKLKTANKQVKNARCHSLGF